VTPDRPTARYFAAAGLVGGAAASWLFWSMENPDATHALSRGTALRVGSTGSLVVFPLVAAALGAAWASVLEAKFGRERVGIAFGSVVAALAFVSFVVLLASFQVAASDLGALPPGQGLLVTAASLVVAYLLFGGALVGWALILLGGITGWLARSRAAATDAVPARAKALLARWRSRLAPRPPPPVTQAPAVTPPIAPAPSRVADTVAFRLGLALLELPIALGVAYAVFVGGYTLGCRIQPCYDLQGLGVMLVALPIGILVGIAYWIVAVKMDKRLNRRLLWDGGALAVAAAAFLVPQYVAHVEASRQAARGQLLQQQAEFRRKLWIDTMRQEAHGPPGTVPPRLEVVDEGSAAVVTNLSTQGRSISLGRVVQDPAAPGGWRGCAMVSDDKWASYDPWLAPKQSVRYVLDRTCADAFAGAPIEYRVGSEREGGGWWSDSAFATPEGRKPRPRR